MKTCKCREWKVVSQRSTDNKNGVLMARIIGGAGFFAVGTMITNDDDDWKYCPWCGGKIIIN